MTYIPSSGGSNPEYLDFYQRGASGTSMHMAGVFSYGFTSPTTLTSYTSTLGMSMNCRMVFQINSITGSDSVTLRGASMDQTTGIVTDPDTDSITIDSTGYWFSNKYFFSGLYHGADPEIEFGAGITAVNYYVLAIEPYVISATSDVTITGYEYIAPTYSSTVDPIVNIKVIKNVSGNKYDVVTLEELGVNGSGDDYVDNLRAGADDRNLSGYSGYMLNSTTQAIRLRQDDFNSYFTSNENVVPAGDGICIYLTGDSSGPSGAEVGKLRLFLSW